MIMVLSNIKFALFKQKMSNVYFSVLNNDSDFFNPDYLLFFNDALRLESYCAFLSNEYMRNDILCSMGLLVIVGQSCQLG